MTRFRLLLLLLTSLSIFTPVESRSMLTISFFQQDNKYQQIIQRGDSFYKNKSYEAAIIEYQKALIINPSATYPKQQIQRINQMNPSQKKASSPYYAKLREGDRLMALGNYDDAISLYNELIAVHPTQQYPKNRIKEIRKEQNDEWKLRQVFHQTIQEADRLYNQGVVNSALIRYKDAHKLILDEAYPIQMIEKINHQLKLEKKTKTEYESLVSRGLDYIEQEELQLAKKAFAAALQIKKEDPFSIEKIAEIDLLIAEFAEKERLYTSAIQRGDVFLKQKLYSKARNSYSKALTFLNRSYPREKLDEINKLMKAKNKRKKSNYERLIKEGDKLFSGSLYVQALNSFKSANKLKPKEDYPLTMIAKIQEKLDKAGLRQLLKTPEDIPKDKKKQFFFKPIPKADRNDNYFHIELSNLSNLKVKVHLDFGMKEEKNGGYAFELQKNESKKIIIPIGNKLKWFSENNNWVSIYCLKGDLRIKQLKISKDENIKN